MADVRESYGQGLKIQYVQSPTEINWNFPLHEQLEPHLSGGPDQRRLQMISVRSARRFQS